MRAIRQICLASALIALSAAQASAQEMKAEVIHWWTSGGESAAVKVFADQFDAAGGTWVDTAIAGGARCARTAGINRIVGGNPPTAMQFNTGKQFDELVANGLLRDRRRRRRGGQLERRSCRRRSSRPSPATAISTPCRSISTARTGSSTIPSLNRRRRRSRPRPGTTCSPTRDKLKASGVDPARLRAASPGERGLFNAVLVGRGRARPVPRRLWHSATRRGASGPSSARSPRPSPAARLVDAGSPGRNWNDATAMVITGKAGDAGHGRLGQGRVHRRRPDRRQGIWLRRRRRRRLRHGRRRVRLPARSSDAAQKAAQESSPRSCSTPETQIAFNKKKGSVPVRLDVDVSSMDACAQKGIAALKDPAQQVPSHRLLSRPTCRAPCRT